MAKAIPLSKGPSPDKAAEMLRDGTANGEPLSSRQKRFFGARAGERSVKNVKRGKRPKAARTSPR